MYVNPVQTTVSPASIAIKPIKLFVLNAIMDSPF